MAPETDGTAISRITKPHVSGRGFRREIAHFLLGLSRSRADDLRKAARRIHRTADRDRFAASWWGNSGSYRNAPVRVAKPPSRLAHMVSSTTRQAAADPRALAAKLPAVCPPPPRLLFPFCVSTAPPVLFVASRSLPAGMNHERDGWHRSFCFLRCRGSAPVEMLCVFGRDVR